MQKIIRYIVLLLLLISILCLFTGCSSTTNDSDTDTSTNTIECEHNLTTVYSEPATCYSEGYQINQCDLCSYNERVILQKSEHSINSTIRQQGNCSIPTITDYNCGNEGCYYHYTEENIEEHNFSFSLAHRSDCMFYLNEVCKICKKVNTVDLLYINSVEQESIVHQALGLKGKTLIRANSDDPMCFEAYENGEWVVKRSYIAPNLKDTIWIAELTTWGAGSAGSEVRYIIDTYMTVEEFLQTYMALQ